MATISSHLRSALERLRLFVKIGGRPRSRVQQIQVHLYRASLALTRCWWRYARLSLAVLEEKRICCVRTLGMSTVPTALIHGV